MQPQRRSYSKSFKAQVIQECAQPGASIASIALNRSLNANLVHKWIRLQPQKSTALQPALSHCPCHSPARSRKRHHRTSALRSSIRAAP
ncbi:transposase [Pseudomonas sp. H1_A05]